jgi:hypothetical protein
LSSASFQAFLAALHDKYQLKSHAIVNHVANTVNFSHVIGSCCFSSVNISYHSHITGISDINILADSPYFSFISTTFCFNQNRPFQNHSIYIIQVKSAQYVELAIHT